MIKRVEQYIRVSFPPSAFLLINAKMPHKLLKIVSAIKTLIIIIFALEWCSSLMFEKSTFLSAMFVLFRSTSDCWKYWRFSKSKVQWEPLFTSSQAKNCHSPHHSSTVQRTLRLDSVQDFLIKLGIKPRLYILKISIFSLNRQTYQNYEQPPQSLQNLYFQSYFSASKINQIFLIFFLWRIFD